jgi:DNA-binding transcriptional LysR family regulator
MNNINLNSLKIFLEVANSNSFLEASNKLFISQPAISKSMSKLEEDLNVTLFFRANKGISLTPSGEILYNYLKEASDLLFTCERALNAINDVEESNIVIGVQSHIVRNYLMDKIDHFKLKHNKIKIELIDMSTNQMLEALENRKLDFIVDSSPIETIYNNITITPVKTLNTCFIASTNNKDKITTLKDLEKEDIILPISRSSLRKNINKVFDENGLDVHIALEFGTEELIIDSVRRNLGIGYVVSDAIDYLVDANILKRVEIDYDLPKMEINIVKIDNNLTKAASLFISEEIIHED